jgi:hypothetical protein
VREIKVRPDAVPIAPLLRPGNKQYRVRGSLFDVQSW